jgi:N-acetylmuramoyl-L-alanine amidase
MLRTFIFALTVLSSTFARADPDISDNSGATQQGPSTEEINSVVSSDVAKALTPPEALAFGPTDLKAFAENAKQSYRRLKTDLGDTSKTYDLIVQPGHFARTSGATGSQGKYVSEQEFAARVVEQLAADLRQRDVNIAIVPADGFNKPLRAKIFLSLHTDGSIYPCSSGPSVGYSSTGDAKGMHGIALALSLTLGIDPVRFMRDNYTENLKRYYAFSSMNTAAFKGLLEIGEITCPTQEEIMLSRADLLAKNLAIAVVFALRPAR